MCACHNSILYLYQDAVNELNLEDARRILSMCVEKHPSLMFDVWDVVEKDEPDMPESHKPGPSSSPSWCKCDNCREMDAEIENVCCGLLPRNCITTSAVSVAQMWL